MAIPQDGIKISDLTSATFSPNSLLPMAVPDPNADTGYTTEQETMQAVGEGIVSAIAYTASALRTVNKTIIGAINETHGVEVEGTLAAGSTSITLSDASIDSDSSFDIYTSVYRVNPTAVSVATGSITLTFEAQAAALGVKVVIR